MSAVSMRNSLAVFVIGAVCASFSLSRDAGAQALRRGTTVRQPQYARAPQTEVAIVSNATSGWLVERPVSKKSRPVVLTSPDNFLWATPLSGSSWISPKPQDGVRNAKTGYYVYTYSFCPALASGTPSLSLSVLADNAFDAKLNGNDFDPSPFQNYGSYTPFQVPQTVSTTSFFKTTGDNVLEIIVENGPTKSPTGLDVAGAADDIEPSC
jgi:hypothetical protein